MNQADAYSYLCTMPPETMLYGRSSFDSGPFETHLLIKEESKYIKRIKYNPMFTLRSSLSEINGVCLVVVMLQPNGDDDMIYESWWNWHQTGGGEKYFRDMITQRRLKLLFYNQNNELADKKEINNSLSLAFAEYYEYIKNKEPWSMAEFDAAREKLYERYPSVKSLWDSMKV